MSPVKVSLRTALSHLYVLPRHRDPFWIRKLKMETTSVISSLKGDEKCVYCTVRYYKMCFWSSVQPLFFLSLIYSSVEYWILWVSLQIYKTVVTFFNTVLTISSRVRSCCADYFIFLQLNVHFFKSPCSQSNTVRQETHVRVSSVHDASLVWL